MGRFLRVVPATEALLVRAAALLRPEDEAECEACGKSGTEALLEGLRVSFVCRVALDDAGEPVFVWGLNRTAEGAVSVWGLSTVRLARCRRAFARTSRRVVFDLRHLYAPMVNVVDARYAAAVRWLEWLGFCVDEVPVRYGAEGRLFFVFRLR